MIITVAITKEQKKVVSKMEAVEVKVVSKMEVVEAKQKMAQLAAFPTKQTPAATRKRDREKSANTNPTPIICLEEKVQMETSLRRWDARSSTIANLTSHEDQLLKRRLLEMGMVTATNRKELFLHHANSISNVTGKAPRWNPKSRTRMWGAVLGARRALGLPVETEDKAFNKIMERDAKTHQPQQARVISGEQWLTLGRIVASMNLMEAAFMLIVTATGQRPVDVARLRRSRIAKIQKFISITFEEGKTVDSTGPFTIHAFRRDYLGTRVWRLAQETTSTFLFMDESTPIGYSKEERVRRLRVAQRWTRSQMERLKEIDRTLSNRTTRRSVLQEIASTGATAESLRLLSRHSTDKMLNVYLDHGAMLMSNARKTATLSSHLLFKMGLGGTEIPENLNPSL